MANFWLSCLSLSVKAEASMIISKSIKFQAKEYKQSKNFKIIATANDVKTDLIHIKM